MLYSAEHNIRPVNKYQITNNSIFFLLNIAEDEKLSAFKYQNSNYYWQFHIYNQREIKAQMSTKTFYILWPEFPKPTFTLPGAEKRRNSTILVPVSGLTMILLMIFL